MCRLFVLLTIVLASHRLSWAAGADDTIAEDALTIVDREHWAYRPLLKPVVPSTVDTSRSLSPMDQFIAARLELLGLPLGPEAKRATLFRRLSYDLTGLPPTVDELEAFEHDLSPDAYERLGDRLLASPAYGERWAQHWLDLARFAETDGFEHDLVRPDAWRYRDWVIDALNADLPYSDFVRRQLAGDECGEGQTAVATLFCLAGPDMPDINDQVERRHVRLNELTATVGAVLLGMQIGCAECHDHKTDPISQADFYRLRAVFEPSVPELKRDAPYLTLANQSNIEPARLWIRGNHGEPGPTVKPALPRIAVPDDRHAGLQKLTAGPGLRSAAAEMMVDGATPLTSRVIVNRCWQQHFGRGLCTTPSDFGIATAEPTHPDLLDWLAVDLIRHDWQLKSLHRQLVSSATYRQSSRRTEHDPDWERRLTLDPENQWWSRVNRRRLDGESLRDALLKVSGTLNDSQQGPGVRPPLPDELVRTLLKDQWIADVNPGEHTRRSIYVFARRNLRYPLFEVFDRPAANASCAVRGRSTTAPQALVLLNGDLSIRSAQLLAGRACSSTPDADERVRILYRLSFSREPAREEATQIAEFVAAQTKAVRSESRSPMELLQPIPVSMSHDPFEGAAWVDASLALLTSNEFLYCD